MKILCFNFIVGLVLGALLVKGVPFAWRHLHPLPQIPILAQGMASGRHMAFVERANKGNIDLLFLGDSLTDWFRDTEAWSQFDGPHTANFSLPSDTIAGLTWRIQHGEMPDPAPRTIVLEIGTNDIVDHSEDQVIDELNDLVQSLSMQHQTSHIIFVLILPRNDGGTPLVQKIENVDNWLQMQTWPKNVDIVKIPLAQFNGRLLSDCAAADGVHLTPEGYKKWAKELSPLIYGK